MQGVLVAATQNPLVVLQVSVPGGMRAATFWTHRSALCSRSSARPTHAPLASSFERQLNSPASFLDAAFSFELAHLSNGSVAAAARCGATTIRPHSTKGSTSIFIMPVPFVSSGVPSSISHVRDELVFAIDLRDRSDFHLFWRIAASIVDREH